MFHCLWLTIFRLCYLSWYHSIDLKASPVWKVLIMSRWSYATVTVRLRSIQSIFSHPEVNCHRSVENIYIRRQWEWMVIMVCMWGPAVVWPTDLPLLSDFWNWKKKKKKAASSFYLTAVTERHQTCLGGRTVSSTKLALMSLSNVVWLSWSLWRFMTSSRVCYVVIKSNK